jgi:GC-rich sequence DNA-binding factor
LFLQRQQQQRDDHDHGIDFMPPPPRGQKDDGTAAVIKKKTPKYDEDALDEIVIPDAAAIVAAKAKRERMRTAASSAPEFIPVPGSEDLVALAARSGGGGGGARGGDSDDDDVDENVRVKFGVGGEPTGGPKGAGGVLDSMMTVGDDDEDASWDDEQLCKVIGVGGSAAAAKAAKNKAEAAAAAGSSRGDGAAGSGGAKRAPASASNSVAAGGERALAFLRAGLARADASRRAALNELKRADESLASADAALEAHEERLVVAGERYKYVQELRDYFRDLCECLRDKAPIIEELEEHVQRLHEQRGAAAAEAAEAEGSDEAAEAEAAVEAAQAALMRGASAAEAVAAATAAAENAVAARLSGGSAAAELDEFGRDVNLAQRRAAEMRAVARRVRRAKEEEEEDAALTHDPSARAGRDEADDAEDPEEVELFRKGWEDAREAGSCVLRDAGAEFASMAPVKAKSEEWKTRFPKTYRDAFMSASTPQLFAPFVRLELLSWSPLHAPATATDAAPNQPAAPIDGMSWYSELFDYGMSAAQGADADADDADGNLVPTLIEKLVAPVVDHAVRECWDPSSVEQSRRLSGVVKEMLVYLEPGECGAMADLLTSVKKKLREMVGKRCGIPAWPPVVTAAAPAAADYVRRRLGATLRCVRAVVSWHGALPSGEVKALVCDGIISQHVAPHLRLLLARPGECLRGIERTVDAIGPDGAGWLVRGGGSSNNVSPVRSVAATLGQLVRSNPEAHGAAAAAKDDAAGKAVDPRRLVRVLAFLGEFHEAQAVAKLFGIE